jgi:hypothetical protein
MHIYIYNYRSNSKYRLTFQPQAIPEVVLPSGDFGLSSRQYSDHTLTPATLPGPAYSLGMLAW